MDKGPITVLGVGRLGLCMALQAERKGYNVLGVDVHPTLIESLNNKTFHSFEPKVVDYLKESKNFKATLSLKDGLAHSDLIFITVPTPTGAGDKSYDHSILSGLLTRINTEKVQNKHVVVCCTTLPGYIAQIGRFLIRDCPGTTLSYNPEFIAQGDIIHGMAHPDMVLIGEANKEVGDKLEEFYNNICESKHEVHRMTAESAEITKIAVNCFITTKISFANMIGDISANTANTDANVILRAVGADSRIGNKYLRPGYGFGGPCFPRDNRALGHYAKSIGVTPIIPEATDNSNKFHTRFQAQQLLDENKDEYFFDAVCYKDNCSVPIIEESQKLEIAKFLALHGKKVTIRDKLPVIQVVQQDFGKLFHYEIIN